MDNPPQQHPPPSVIEPALYDPLRVRWEGSIDSTVKDHERRLAIINGQIDSLRKTVWRWSGALAILLLLTPVATALLLREFVL